MDAPFYEVALRLTDADPGEVVEVDDHFTGWRTIGDVELGHFADMAEDPANVVIALAETGAAVLNARIGSGHITFVTLAVRRRTDAA